MYCKIELVPRKAYDESVEDLLWRFLCSLERNGQILKDYKMIKSDNYIFYLTLPKNDSFEEKNDGIYVKRDRAQIREMFDFKLEILGENIESQPYCECTERNAIEMQTHHLDIDSIFTCCDCGKPIALYELPLPPKQEDFYLFQDWQENYAAMHELWINCLCDRYTRNQLMNPESALNKQGMAIADCLSTQLGYKVYYNIYCDGYTKVKRECVDGSEFRICPKCNKTMKPIDFSEDYYMEVCDDCNLSSD